MSYGIVTFVLRLKKKIRAAMCIIYEIEFQKKKKMHDRNYVSEIKMVL